MDTRQEGLGAMVVEKWLRENHNAGHHLEIYNSEKLHNLMFSRIRKLSNQVASGEIEPMPIHADSLDKIFESLVDAGLLVAENPKVMGEAERAAAAEAADMVQARADAQFMIAIMGYEKTVGQRGISEWYHKAPKEYKQWYDRLFPSGAVKPESVSQQANLFLVKATFPDGRIKFVSGDVNPVPLDSTAAHRFGRTNAERYAGLLAKQRPELKKIEIVPLTQDRESEVSDEELDKYAGNFMREFYPKYIG